MDHLTRMEELLNQANDLIKNNKYEEAENKLEEIIKVDPNFGKAYNHLGYLYEVKFRDYEKGETLYNIALEKSPMYTATYYNYAVLLSTVGKFDKLKELLDTALGIPGIIKSTIHNEYGIMHEQQGQFDLAIDHYRKCALNSLDQGVIDRAKQSIARCNSKRDI